MATTQKSFEVALQKGKIGEDIVRALLERKGWVVYQPETEGAHCFDMLSIKDKKYAIAIDVKAKAPLNKWPATGINERHFQEYLHFSQKHKMPFWVIFVDEQQGLIYGNTIEELEKPRTVEGMDYPILMNWQTPIRIWPLAAMKTIARLREHEMENLAQMNQRQYNYKPEYEENHETKSVV